MRYNNDNNTESGVYYVVPERNGKPGSKRIVRRPRAPLTSVPLDDDFDAITRTTMYTGKGRYSWVPTQSPLDDEFDAVTYTNTNTNFEKIDEVDEELLEEVEDTEGGRDTVNGGRMRREDEEDERDNENTPRRVEQAEDNRQKDVFHRYRRASTSRVDDYGGYRRQRSVSRAEPRVTPSPNTQNGRYHPRPCDDFASRYIPSRERTPRSSPLNGNTEPSQLVRSASRRSSNRNQPNSQPQHQPQEQTQNGHTRGAVYRSEEIVRNHRTNTDDYHQRAPSVTRRRRDSGLSGRSRSRSRSRARTTKLHTKAVTTTKPNPHLRPPARQQSYEVVKSRVLEDTPEKTVTISTWRERVAEANGAETGGGGGRGNGEEETRMSVYYVDADDYPIEDRNGRVIELEQRVYEEGGNGGTVEWMGSKSPRIAKWKLGNGESRKGKEQEQLLVQRDKDVRDRALTAWPSMSELGDIDEELQEDEDDAEDEHKKLTHRRSQSLPTNFHWRDPDELDPNPDRSGNFTHPRTSTPIRGPSSFENNPPKSVSLLPTRSNGSTISSIRSLRLATPRPSSSTQPSSIHPPPQGPQRSVTEILASCKPSLAHLERILHELGMRTEDHFKAVAKMSEVTRDREIKRIAVEKGVTVLEWAMLIDKMQSL